MIPSAFDDSTGILSGDGSVLASLLKPLYAPLSINYGEFNQPLNPFLAETPELRNILDLGIGSDTESPFDTLRLGLDPLTGYTPDTPLIGMESSASLLVTDTASTSTPLSFTESATQGQTETTVSLTALISPEPSESPSSTDPVALSLTESEPQGRTAAVMALAASTGTGLTAEYFDNINFTQLKMRRIDAAVDFNWQLRSPHPDIGSDTFSVRWSGKIEPLYSETYTFSVPASGGVRLWIDNQLILNNPLNGLLPITGQISLQAGQQYDIRLEYYEDLVNSDIRLEWQSASQSLEVVPTSLLFPTDAPPISPLAAFQVPLVSNPTLTGTIEVVDRQTILGLLLYNEFGLYQVDDEYGRIGDLLPGDIGYNSAALSAERRVASLGRNDTEVVLEFEPGQWLAAYYKPVPLGLLNPITTHFSFTAANLDQTDHVQEQDLGFSNFEVAFEDLILGGNQDFNDLVAQVRFVNTDPIWTTDPIEEALAGYTYTYDAEAIDAEGDTLTYRLLNSPEGMTIDATTGLISWQPDEGAASDYSIIVQVDDGRGGVVEQTYTLSVQSPPRFTVDDVTLVEGNNGITEAVFAVQASAGTIYPMTVDYTTVDGTATAGVDYTAQSGRLTFAPGETIQTIAVPIFSDTLHEWDETFTLTLSNPNYAAIEDGEGLGTIADDDEPPTAVIDNVEITEGDNGSQDVTFTVNLSTASGRPITIDYETGDGSAISGADYEGTSGTLTFNPGEISQTITVSALNDSRDEPTETFTVDLLNPVNVTLADNQGLGTILDNDEPPAATINDVQIVEGDSGQTNAIFTVSLSAASGYPITIDYTTADGTAIAGVDYTAVNATLTFEPGEVVQTISVPVLGDVLNEWDEETFTINLSNPVNVTLAANEETGTGIITDDDLLPEMIVGDATVSEDGSGSLLFTVTLSAPSGRPITVNYATADGTATAGQDYQSVTGTLAFEAGETVQTVIVPVLNDALDEPDQETLFLNLANVDYATVTDGEGLGTITDDDAPPQAVIDDVQIVEGDSGQTNAVFTINLTGASQLPITVDFTTTDGTAAAGFDYEAVSGTLSFNPGETTQTISVPILGDALDEWDEETFVVDLSNPTNVTLANSQGTGTISDNDPFPDVTVGDVTVGEDESGNLQFTVTLSAPSGRPITLDYVTADGTAIADQDYQSVAGTLTFNPGETIQTVTVPVLNDALDEPDQETLILNLTNPSYATIMDEQAVGTITDDDALPEAIIDDVQLIEGNNGEIIARFTVSLSTESRRSITIEYETADASQNSAFGTIDYQPAAGTLTFNPGELSQTIDVLIIGDTLDELDEAFLVNLMNPINVSLIDDQGTGTILDDDLPPTLSVDDIMILESDEGQSQATFTVSLSAPSSFPVTVAYTTVNGTAIAGEDYVATNGTLTFSPGETTQTVQVTILGDTIGELNEAFELQLSQSVNATLDDAVGQATITDSDVVLQEGTDFRVGYVYDLAIPPVPSILRFTYSPAFDTSDPDAINDAFEVALVDSKGNPLTHVIAPGRDAFFNWTEAEDVALAAGVTHDAANRTVSLNLTGLPVGTDATVLFRLVNNDSDTTTQVQLANFVIEAAPVGTQPATDASPADLPTPTPGNPNTTALSDVSSSIQANYHQSSFNPDTGRLYTNVSLENIGTYGLNGPLWVAISNISDPSVGVDGADGITADGLPYYDFSHLITDGTFDPTAVTDERSLVFTNPDQIQFTYDLIILSTLNQGPVIESNPGSEGIVGQAYVYDVDATDPDGDSLTYDLLVAPDGMTVDAETGLIQWAPTDDALGNHSVWVQVTDGRGGTAQQQFTLAIVTEPTNRPPLFSSDPVIDAFINQLYEYDADAVDPDGDLLDYQIILGPDGMTINSETGAVEWTPPSALVVGDTVLGQISTPGENDEFTFSGVRGQRIYFDPLRYSGSSSDWDIDIYSPSGELIVNGGELGINDNRLLVLEETGNYRIVVDAQDDHAGSYGFSLIDLALVPVAPLDQRIEGTLSPGTEDDVYRFSGVKGQKLFIDQISKAGSLDWVLYDADGQQVSFSSAMSDMEIDSLPKDGEYYLTLRGESGFTSTVSYAFEIITPDELSAPMLLGDNIASNTVTGEITEKGEEDIYTFEGVAGQRLLLDRLFVNSSAVFSHTVSIIDPVGNIIQSHNLSNSDPSPLTLDRDGLYQVRVDASGESTGSYGFNLLDLGSATSIDFHEPDASNSYSGTLNPGQESHLYQFSGTAGQRLYFDTQGASGGTWSLYDSGNQRITSSSLNSDLEVVLDDTDTYTLLLEGNRTTPISYNFKVITPELDIEPNPISYDTTVSGEITEKGERDVYTFTALQGQRLFLDTLDNRPNLRVTLVSPIGSQTGLSDTQFATDWTRNPFVLPEDGQYELIVDGAGEATGSYRFRMADVGGADVLPMNTPTSGTLAPDHSIKFYQFTGNVGDRLYFDSQTTTSSVNWHLYSASNNEINEVSLNSDFEQVLQADGTYYLMLRSENSQPVSYTIQVVPTDAEPAPVAYALGATVSGSITELGEQGIYSVELTAGQRLYWDAQAGDSAVTVTLVGANGTIFEGDTGQDGAEIFVRQSGTYQLIIDGQVDATDTYQFQLLNIADQPSLTFGSSLSGTLAAQQTKLYQFTGTKGQQLVFDRIAGGSGAEWTLYGPGAQPNSGSWTVGSAPLSNDFTSTLAADGIYTLALRNPSNSSVSYSIQVNDVSVAPTTDIGLTLFCHFREKKISVVG